MNVKDDAPIDGGPASDPGLEIPTFPVVIMVALATLYFTVTGIAKYTRTPEQVCAAQPSDYCIALLKSREAKP